MSTYTVTFRIAGQRLDLDVVTADLGMTPTSTWRAREHHANSPMYKTAIWEYELGSRDWPKQWKSLAEGLEELLLVMKPLREKIAAYQQTCEVCFWCGHFSSEFDGGPTLPPALLKALAEFGVKVQIQWLFPGENAPLN